MISVIVAAINEAGYITDTIDSANPEAKEIIVVDGGSTDDTAAVAEVAELSHPW